MGARNWQQDAYKAGRDARFFLIQAPGGSGAGRETAATRGLWNVRR